MKKYQKLEIKGKGSYGSAYLVKEITTQKLFIMKIIGTQNMSLQQIDFALKEAQILKDLKHPSIIKYQESFYENYEKNSNFCIIMEYAERGNLEQQLLEFKINNLYLEESQIIDWFVQICLAVKYLHDSNIIHRDIKTQNIFITKDNFIKLGDFGIARELECSEQLCKTSLGTPYFLSPEAFQSKPYNVKSDMWSLGCVLYEMMALRHTFDAKTIEGLGIKILRGQYPLVPKHYSEELKQLLTKLLVVQPDKRLSINQLLSTNILKQAAKRFLSNYSRQKYNNDFLESNSSKLTNKLEILRENLEKQLGLQKLQIIIQKIQNNDYDGLYDQDAGVLEQVQNLISIEKQIFQ